MTPDITLSFSLSQSLKDLELHSNKGKVMQKDTDLVRARFELLHYLIRVRWITFIQINNEIKKIGEIYETLFYPSSEWSNEVTPEEWARVKVFVRSRTLDFYKHLNSMEIGKLLEVFLRHDKMRKEIKKGVKKRAVATATALSFNPLDLFWIYWSFAILPCFKLRVRPEPLIL
jgi:hypothetical protein